MKQYVKVYNELCKILYYDTERDEYTVACRCGVTFTRKANKDIDKILKEGCKHCNYYILANKDKFRGISNFKDIEPVRFNTVHDDISVICPKGHKTVIKVRSLYSSSYSCRTCKHCILNSDYLGKRFSRLVVVSPYYSSELDKYTVDAICDCGNKVQCKLQSLFFSKHSCGCLKLETVRKTKRDTLAKATETRNNSNKAYSSNVSTGIKNISKLGNKYQVSIIRGKGRFVRYCETLEEAISVKEWVLEKIRNNNGKLDGSIK